MSSVLLSLVALRFAALGLGHFAARTCCIACLSSAVCSASLQCLERSGKQRRVLDRYTMLLTRYVGVGRRAVFWLGCRLVSYKPLAIFRRAISSNASRSGRSPRDAQAGQQPAQAKNRGPKSPRPRKPHLKQKRKEAKREPANSTCGATLRPARAAFTPATRQRGDAWAEEENRARSSAKNRATSRRGPSSIRATRPAPYCGRGPREQADDVRRSWAKEEAAVRLKRKADGEDVEYGKHYADASRGLGWESYAGGRVRAYSPTVGGAFDNLQKSLTKEIGQAPVREEEE